MSRQTTRELSDPRVYQVAVLLTLLLYGAVELDFEIRLDIALAITFSALVAQLLFSKLWKLPRFELRSAAISTLSLCLLLRTTSITTALLAGFLTIGSKFALRHRDKHFFNPTAFGIAAVLLLTDDAWVSAGQWGVAPLLALAVACLGSLVVRRARRSDVTWAFLGSYLTLLAARAAWLGDPIAIPLHVVESGAFLIFAFFMVSDPRTTPDSRSGRVVFACLVAAGALFIRFGLYHTNGLIWSLVACASLVPALNRLLPGRRYEWGVASRTGTHGGKFDVAKNDLGAVLPGLRAAR